MTPEVVESALAFEGAVFRVRVDRVRRSATEIDRVDVVEHRGAVALLPVDSQGGIWFVSQYRHPAAKVLLELPAGVVEPPESAEACAARECREEIGMAPGRLERLGGFFLAPGYSTEYLQVFLATDLSPAPLRPDEDEQLRTVVLRPEQALERMRTGEIQDAKSLAAMLLALPRFDLGS